MSIFNLKFSKRIEVTLGNLSKVKNIFEIKY